MCPMRRTWRRPSRWARSHGTGWSLLWDRYAPTLLWDSAAVGDGSYIVIYNRRASSCCACNMPVLRCRILVRCCGSQSLSLCMHAFLSELFVPPPSPSSSILCYGMLCRHPPSHLVHKVSSCGSTRQAVPPVQQCRLDIFFRGRSLARPAHHPRRIYLMS